MTGFNLTSLKVFNFNGLNVDQVGIDTSVYDPGSSTDYVPGSTTYTVLGDNAGSNSGFGSNDADGGQGTINTVIEMITNASVGVSLTGGAIANPLAIGQIEDTITENGNVNNPLTFDVLGYSGDGQSILVGLTSSYSAASPNDPYNGQYYVYSYNNIDGNATPSGFFPTNQTFSPSNTLLSNNVSVSNSLIGKTIPSGDLVLTANGSAGVRVNPDGSFTVLATTTTLAVGAITTIAALLTANTGSQGQPTLTFSDAVTPLHYQVIGFNSTQVLLQSVTAAGTPASGPSYAILSITNQPPQTSPVNLTFVPVGTAPIVGTAIPCFLAGTRIATPQGERNIETLVAGDVVLTAEGAGRPVRWLGRSTVSTNFTDPLRTMPIRIAAGALAQGVPVRDLFVSPDHALFIEGVLVQAGALVNGTTIIRYAAMPSSFTYYHLELDQHCLIVAEAAVTESFVDNVDRMVFDNWDEHPAVDGEEMVELPYARAKSARQVPVAVRRAIAAREIALCGKPALAA